MMNQPIIIGNTKSYINSLKDFYKTQNEIWKNLDKENYKYHLAVPDSLIFIIQNEKYKAFTVGSQNIQTVDGGACTGLDNIENIIEAGAKFTILGHSEVRGLGENNENVNKKLLISLEKELKTVLCIGEKERIYGEDNYIEVINNMLTEGLKDLDRRRVGNLIVAYEPVWAIGAVAGASIDNVLEVSILIRRKLADLFGIENAKKIKILYGGSVDENNAKKYVEEASVDGVLVGRACMDSDKFSKIINSLYSEE